MIRLVVDSTADVSKAFQEKANIFVVPLKVNYNDHEYFDGVTLSRDTFYHAMVVDGVFPKTSQPSPEAFVEVFEQIKAADDEAICITLSSSLSGTYQSACLAKKICNYAKIHIIDSLSATAGALLLVEEAARMIQAGSNVETIVKTIEELKNRIHISAALDTLEYLKKGGRISPTAAAIGSLARIKPIITVNVKGFVDVYAKAIGYKKAQKIILEALQDADPHYPIHPVYTYGTNNLEQLLALLKENGHVYSEAVQINPTIGSHIGPEVFGCCFIGSRRD